MIPIYYIFVNLIVFFITFNAVWANDYQSQINELSQIVAKCVQERDTNHHVFYGCIDWHSSVHGNWALIFSSKTNGQTPQKIFSTLNRSNIQFELELLKSSDQMNQSFEMPYGRAWFLQLVRDSEIMFDNSEMKDAAQYVYDSLMKYAKSGGGSFISSKYDNASWYFYQLYQWADHIQNRKDKDLLKDLALNRLNKITNWPSFSENTGFFEPKALALLLLEAIVDDSNLVNKLEEEINRDGLNPKMFPFSTAHQGGLNYSRAWGLWALYNLTKDEKYKKSWQKHMEYMIKNINSWKYDYENYGHWIGQFGLFSYRNAVIP
ncbi:MAG: hypothetical protein CSA15_05035 [Candidatus Delongbacteria bacterium]|nr:MAG: hypothetical protein CSA15_05035 [Candidatus Delongbacteria bacterium]